MAQRGRSLRPGDYFGELALLSARYEVKTKSDRESVQRCAKYVAETEALYSVMLDDGTLF